MKTLFLVCKPGPSDLQMCLSMANSWLALMILVLISWSQSYCQSRYTWPHPPVVIEWFVTGCWRGQSCTGHVSSCVWPMWCWQSCTGHLSSCVWPMWCWQSCTGHVSSCVWPMWCWQSCTGHVSSCVWPMWCWQSCTGHVSSCVWPRVMWCWQSCTEHVSSCDWPMWCSLTAKSISISLLPAGRLHPSKRALFSKTTHILLEFVHFHDNMLIPLDRRHAFCICSSLPA